MPAAERELQTRLKRLFLEELDDQMGRIELGLETLSSKLPEVPTDTVDELFRAAHSLKGAAQAVGASDVSSNCHHLEDALVRVKSGSLNVDEPLLSKWTVLADRIRKMGAVLRQGGEPDTAAASAPPADLAPARTRSAIPGDGTVRVGRRKLDALIAQAGDLVTSSYTAESLVSDSEAASDRLALAMRRWRLDRDDLEQRLVAIRADGPDHQEILERIDTRFDETARDLDRLARSAVEHQRSLRGLATNFSDAARRARTVPFADATSGLARWVRELAGGMAKQARLVVDATDVEIDKELAARLKDVLRHLVRNAVDHGLEHPADRSAQGKPLIGTIEISADLRSNGIEVNVRDDGRGVDLVRVREAARGLGVEERDDDEGCIETLFTPGLTTAAIVGEVSGRGVGLDAVRAAVEGAGGTVTLRAVPGSGTGVQMIIPMVSSTVRAVLVRTGAELVAVPASAIERVLWVPPENPHFQGREVISLEEKTVPVVSASRLLGWNEPGSSEAVRRDGPGLLIACPAGSVVLTVTELVAEQEIVLRAAPAQLAKMPILLGTTQTAQGSVALVLSPTACVRAALSAPSEPASRAAEPEAPAAARQVLLVEDTLMTRELERSILEMAGYSVTVAVDGQEAWRILQARTFDLVVSDINMPRMDGIALCRAIRNSRVLAGLPVLLVTSLHSEADRRRGLDAGADGYLTKVGFDRDELLSAVERLL